MIIITATDVLDDCIVEETKIVTTLHCNKISGFSLCVYGLLRKRCTVVHVKVSRLCNVVATRDDGNLLS